MGAEQSNSAGAGKAGAAGTAGSQQQDFPRFSLEDVAKHNSAADCWIIIDGEVFDVTKFMDEHPGGPDIILEQAGKDCTSEFNDIHHPVSALEMMDKYLVGHVKKAW